MYFALSFSNFALGDRAIKVNSAIVDRFLNLGDETIISTLTSTTRDDNFARAIA